MKKLTAFFQTGEFNLNRQGILEIKKESVNQSFKRILCRMKGEP